MNCSMRAYGLCLLALLATSCASTQSRYSTLGQSYPPKPETEEVQVFQNSKPQRPFIKVSRLDVHIEKTHFLRSSLQDALPELKKQARLSGADAIIDIEERSSALAETEIYHVSATGIRFTNSP